MILLLIVLFESNKLIIDNKPKELTSVLNNEK